MFLVSEHHCSGGWTHAAGLAAHVWTLIVVSHHSNINDLSGRLHCDALQLAQTVLELSRGVGGGQLHHTLIQQQMVASLGVLLELLLFFPEILELSDRSTVETILLPCLIHCEVVIINIGVVTLELVQLDVDDPLLVLLRHQTCVLILGVGVVPPPASHLLLLLRHASVQERVSSGVGRHHLSLLLSECFMVVSVVSRPAVSEYSQSVNMTRHQVTTSHTLITKLYNISK